MHNELKKRRRKKNRSAYVFPIIVLLVCAAYTFRFFYYNIDKEVVKYDKIENTIAGKAIIIRKEWITPLPTEIDNSSEVNEGSRVAFGTKLLVINKNSSTDENISLKIAELDKRINEIKQSEAENNFFSQDKEKIDFKIIDKISEIKEITKSGDLTRLADAKKDLEASLYKKSLIYGTDSFSGKNLEQLVNEKSSLEELYKKSMDVIYAQNSGVVSFEVDGYENILNPSNIPMFHVNEIKEITNKLTEQNKSKEIKKESGLKIVDNFEWYLSIIVKNDDVSDMEEKKAIKVRLKDFDNMIISGQIFAISESENGERLITIKTSEQFTDFYKTRLTNVEIIKNYSEGFAVPSECIVKKEDLQGVYVNKGGIVKFIPVDIVAVRGSETLVKNISANSLENSSNWSKLKEFDEVIKSIKRVRDNQILPGSI